MLDEELWDEQRQKKKRLVLLALLLILGLMAAVPIFQPPGASPTSVAEAVTATTAPSTPVLATPTALLPTATSTPVLPVASLTPHPTKISIATNSPTEMKSTPEAGSPTAESNDQTLTTPAQIETGQPGPSTALLATSQGEAEVSQPGRTLQPVGEPSITAAVAATGQAEATGESQPNPDGFTPGSPAEESTGAVTEEARADRGVPEATRSADQASVQAAAPSSEAEQTEVKPTPITSSRFGRSTEPESLATGSSENTAPPPDGLPVTGNLSLAEPTMFWQLVGPAAGVIVLLLVVGLRALVESDRS